MSRPMKTIVIVILILTVIVSDLSITKRYEYRACCLEHGAISCLFLIVYFMYRVSVYMYDYDYRY